MMAFIKSWQFMAIIVGIVGVAAIVGVIYGVTTHTEPGFATASTPITDGFVPPEYGPRPIDVCVQSYPTDGATADDLALVDDVVGTINGRVGFALLHSGDERDIDACDMVVTIGAPQDVSTPGRHTDTGGASGICGDSCCIEMVNTTSLTSLALEHEIGHCLGLAHDGYRASIMFGGPGNALRPSAPGTYPPRISDSDRELLRQRFMPR